MSSTIYCARCDSHITVAMKSFHDSACGPVANEPAGYDPYNSAERLKPLQFDGRDDHRSNDFNLPMLLRRQAS